METKRKINGLMAKWALVFVLAAVLAMGVFALSGNFAAQKASAAEPEVGLPQVGDVIVIKSVLNRRYVHVDSTVASAGARPIRAFYEDYNDAPIAVKDFAFEVIGVAAVTDGEQFNGIPHFALKSLGNNNNIAFDQWEGGARIRYGLNPRSGSAAAGGERLVFQLNADADGTFSFFNTHTGNMRPAYVVAEEASGFWVGDLRIPIDPVASIPDEAAYKFTWEKLAKNMPNFDYGIQTEGGVEPIVGNVIDLGAVESGYDALQPVTIALKNTTTTIGPLADELDASTKIMTGIYIGYPGQTVVPLPPDVGRIPIEEDKPFILERPNNGMNISSEQPYTRHGISSIAYNATGTFTITPKTGLTPGDYTEDIEIFCSVLPEVITLTVTFMVLPSADDPAIKTALGTAINAFLALEEYGFTPASWAVADLAYQAALILYEDDSLNGLDQLSINSATQALQNAINALVPTANKGALAAAILEYGGLDAQDYAAYSWSLLVAAAEIAQSVFGDIDATQGEVNTAAQNLREALDALEEADAEIYEAEISPTSKVFTAAMVGYGVQGAQVITVKNTGVQTVTGLTAALTSGTAFEIFADLSATSVASNDSVTLEVRPKTGLAVGVYTDTLTVTGNNDIALSVTLSFTVTPRTYSITVVGGSGSQSSAAAGASINIGATIPDGKEFDKWESADGVTFTDATSGVTSFVMPAKDVTVTAVFKDVVVAPVTYLVTVTGGTGGGQFAAGAQVSITAAAAEAGKVFDKWVSADGVVFAAEGSATTTFVMLEKSVTVTATYKDAPVVTTYLVTVTNGTGGGQFAEGVTVTIEAAAAPTDKVFDKWTSADGVTFAAETSVTTTFVMPAKAVTVTATWKDAPTEAEKFVVTVTGGTGGGQFASGVTVSITANTPAQGKVFDKWISSDGVVFANEGSASTTFVMLEKPVTVTATYKDAEPVPKEPKPGCGCGSVTDGGSLGGGIFGGMMLLLTITGLYFLLSRYGKKKASKE
ncbi:MAG: hypothetical protein FWD58_08720 [Firmicutes bacterium]|nr:hypothetical protein [Bacillota bacterium]